MISQGAETDEKAEVKTEAKSATFWINQLDYAATREEKWRKAGDEIQCRYMDDRDHYEGGKQFEKRINILWANTEVQKGALFDKLGKPDVRRCFPLPGNRNKIARTAALVMERALVACANRYEPDVQIENAVEDELLPGRGVCWIDYEPVIGMVEVDEKQPDGTTATVEKEQITYQNVKFDHVEWKSFRHGNGRSWDDVPWVARELLFTKTDLKKRWGDKLGARIDAIPVNQIVDEEHINAEAKKDGSFKRARVWEIWYKPDQIRVYVAEGFDEELERQDDPYKLEGFFPCPRPLYAVKTTSSQTPRPEFLQYKDQADELDRVNTRIWKLLEKLKYCGVYDGNAEDAEALKDIGILEDGQFKPYKNFAALAERGGLAAAFQARDLAPIAATVQALAERAVRLLQAIYEITGISDIMRGSSDSNETLGAQKLKANFGSGRLRRKQKDVQRFVKSLYRMKAEIIAEHFEREQLEMMTGIQLPLEVDRSAAQMKLQQIQQMMQAAQQAQQQPPQEGQPPAPPPQMPPMPDKDEMADLQALADACSWEEISEILRSDDRRNYTIDVETDETAFADEETEKQQRTEFMGAMTQWLQVAIPAIQANPTQAPLFKELTMFFMGGFKVGRSLEETFEDAFDQIKNAPPQPNPEAQKMEMEAKAKEAELQGKMQAQQADMAFKQQDAQLKMKQAEGEFAMKQQELAAQLEFKRQELGIKQQELEFKKQTSAFDMQLKQQQASQQAEQQQFDRQAKSEEMQFQRENATAEREFKGKDFELRAYESDHKRHDMDERRQADIQDKTERRELEASFQADKVGKSTSQLNEKVISAEAQRQGQERDGLRQEVHQVAQAITEQQAMIAEALKRLFEKQDETQDALLSAIKSLTAPRTIKRDPKTGRALGVELAMAQ